MKTFSLYLAALLIWNSVALADSTPTASKSPQTQSQKDKNTAKVESAVRECGTGERCRFKVTRTNGSHVKGYTSKIDESSFAVTDKKTGQTTTIAYAEVQKIQAGLSKGDKIGLGVVGGVVVALVVVALIVGRALSHS